MSRKPRCYNIKISNVAYFEFILAASVLMRPLILRGFSRTDFLSRFLWDDLLKGVVLFFNLIRRVFLPLCCWMEETPFERVCFVFSAYRQSVSFALWSSLF